MEKKMENFSVTFVENIIIITQQHNNDKSNNNYHNLYCNSYLRRGGRDDHYLNVLSFDIIIII